VKEAGRASSVSVLTYAAPARFRWLNPAVLQTLHSEDRESGAPDRPVQTRNRGRSASLFHQVALTTRARTSPCRRCGVAQHRKLIRELAWICKRSHHSPNTRAESLAKILNPHLRTQ